MIVKDLIELLKQFDPNMTVVYQTQEDTYEPYPHSTEYTFDTTYYNGKEFKSIKKNTPFVML